MRSPLLQGSNPIFAGGSYANDRGCDVMELKIGKIARA